MILARRKNIAVLIFVMAVAVEVFVDNVGWGEYENRL
jgi:hypothetical protein